MLRFTHEHGRIVNMKAIDWAGLLIEYDHEPIENGYTIEVTPDGEYRERKIKRTNLRSSWETNMQIWTDEEGRLGTSGNPQKFISGHNVFGPEGITACAAAINQVTKMLKLGRSPGAVPEESIHGARPTRIDIAQSIRCPDEDTTKWLLRTFQETAIAKYWGKPSTIGLTTYFGKGSRYTTMKAYHKGDEMNVHHLSRRLKERERALLKIEASTLARFELTLADKWFVKNPMTLGEFTPEKIDELYNHFMERIQFTPNIEIPTETLNQLPSGSQLVYYAWKTGTPITALGMEARTRRRHVSVIKKILGVDVTKPFNPELEHYGTMPLEAEPAEIPQWIINDGLIIR